MSGESVISNISHEATIICIMAERYQSQPAG